jgi:hypothetical protein
VIVNADSTPGAADSNVVPPDGVLLRSGGKFQSVNVRVVRADASDKEVPIQALTGFDHVESGCRVGGLAFYVGDASREVAVQEREEKIASARSRYCR